MYNNPNNFSHNTNHNFNNNPNHQFVNIKTETTPQTTTHMQEQTQAAIPNNFHPPKVPIQNFQQGSFGSIPFSSDEFDRISKNLEKKVSKDDISYRPQGNSKVPYLETWRALGECNSINSKKTRIINSFKK